MSSSVCGNLVCSSFYGLTHIIAHSCILHQYPINFRFISYFLFFFFYIFLVFESSIFFNHFCPIILLCIKQVTRKLSGHACLEMLGKPTHKDIHYKSGSWLSITEMILFNQYSELLLHYQRYNRYMAYLEYDL